MRIDIRQKEVSKKKMLKWLSSIRDRKIYLFVITYPKLKQVMDFIITDKPRKKFWNDIINQKKEVKVIK